MANTTIEKPATLTRAHSGERCDSCGAMGVWAVDFSASELIFCNHHYNRFELKFEDNVATKLTFS